jgi:predicted permease
MAEELDDLSKFEAVETSRKLPAGWLLLFFGLIAWGAWYLWAYTPALGGWSQDQDLAGASPGANLFATILFTALPTAVAVVLILAQRKKKG